ncbi:hypothetical protein D9M71_526530 [compost metagenome]
MAIRSSLKHLIGDVASAQRLGHGLLQERHLLGSHPDQHVRLLLFMWEPRNSITEVETEIIHE